MAQMASQVRRENLEPPATPGKKGFPDWADPDYKGQTVFQGLQASLEWMAHRDHPA